MTIILGACRLDREKVMKFIRAHHEHRPRRCRQHGCRGLGGLLGQLIVAVAGACILILAYRAFQGVPPKPMATLLDTRLRHPEKAHRADTPLLRKPEWIRVKAPGSPIYAETQKIVRENGLVTVCEEAGCPNIGECWSKKHATFMIMGDTCTRACAFCNVKTGLPGSP